MASPTPTHFSGVERRTAGVHTTNVSQQLNARNDITSAVWGNESHKYLVFYMRATTQHKVQLSVLSSQQTRLFRLT